MTLLLRAIPWIPRVLVVLLMLIAMIDMLVGVFLRYVMTWVSATFDLPSIRFFWVEEIGEYSLAWLTFIGAALGIRRGVHFSVQMLTERWPLGARRALVAVHYVLLAGFDTRHPTCLREDVHPIPIPWTPSENWIRLAARNPSEYPTYAT